MAKVEAASPRPPSWANKFEYSTQAFSGQTARYLVFGLKGAGGYPQGVLNIYRLIVSR